MRFRPTVELCIGRLLKMHPVENDAESRVLRAFVSSVLCAAAITQTPRVSKGENR